MSEQNEFDIHLAIRNIEQEINHLKSRVRVLEQDSESANDYIAKLDEHFGEIVKYIQSKDL